MDTKTGHLQALTNHESSGPPLRVIPEGSGGPGPAPSAAGEAAAGVWRVHAVIPCFNRPADLAALLRDLFDEAVGLRGRAEFSATVVDNASSPPLRDVVEPERARWAGEGLALEVLRLDENHGGSGGFNAGMQRTLAAASTDRAPAPTTEAFWLLDSDARLEPGALPPLLAALDADSALAAVGSALADPRTGEVFEVGGTVSRRTGEMEQPLPDGWASRPVVEVEYAAACSLLIRRQAVERAGVMADLFLNGDDAEWCCRIRRRTGQRIAVATRSVARHPRPDRMRTAARYYAARNTFAVIAAATGGRPSRSLLFRRALREVGRALAMTMLGRDDLARLHLRGLQDAAAGIRGPAPGGTPFEPWSPPERLAGAVRTLLFERAGGRGRVAIRAGTLPDEAPLRRALHDACVDPLSAPTERDQPRRPGPLACAWRAARRLLAGPDYGIAVVPARAWPEDWLCARAVVAVAPEGFVIRRLNRAERAGRLLRVLAAGLWTSARLAARGVPPALEELADDSVERHASGPAPLEGAAPAPAASAQRPTVSVVILSHNRFDALEKTVERLLADPALKDAEIIVADNASTDGTPDRFRRRFRDLRLLDMDSNIGVAAFNRAVARTTGETVLILDDDAAPADGALARALDLLAQRPAIAAVALHPRHPRTQESEWPFARAPDDRFPFMGCGNLIRRDAWDRAGGYEEAFFLYRNDTDLALKLLGAGEGVHFDPALVVWHDSPAARRKSPRWFELATRNWVWLCRRHARARWLFLGILSGWAWAHRLAGANPRAHWRALWGALDGLRTPPPRVPESCRRRAGAFERVMRYRLRGRGVREPRPQ